MLPAGGTNALGNSNSLFNEASQLKEMQVCFLPNQVLFAEGDTSTEMYILLSGKVEILKNGSRIAIVEEEGSYLGELSTLLGQPRSATVRTMSQCQFIAVRGDKVKDFFNCSPMLGLKLARMLAERLVNMNINNAKLAKKSEAVSSALDDATKKLKNRDQQIRQLVSRIEKIKQLNRPASC